jgi:hypothetical protein
VALLLPFFLLTITVRSKSDWLWLAIAYFLPWIGLIFGRQGNQVLLISTFGLMILVWQKSKSEQSLLDGHPQAMYNQRNSLREE